MRLHPFLLLVVGLGVASCDDNVGPVSVGTLVVTTSTGGSEPDPDGYLLTVDETHSLALDPTGTAEIDVPVGRRLLRLRGVAEHCVVDPALPLPVNVALAGMTPVAFDISCFATGVRVTVITTGVDVDLDGYRLVVDGADRGAIPVNATLLTLLAPGNRTIVLRGLAANCRMNGPDARTVTVVETGVQAVEFAVACTATTGAIGVFLAVGDVEGLHTARVDGGPPLSVALGAPAFLSGVTPGDHVVTLVSPDHCSVENDTQSVTVIAGGLVRDTAEVTFRVTCEPTRFRITAPTTGPLPQSEYAVWGCDFSTYYCYYQGTSFLGSLSPQGTLFIAVAPERDYYLELRDIPAGCRAEVPNINLRTPAPGDTVDVAFPVACEP